MRASPRMPVRRRQPGSADAGAAPDGARGRAASPPRWRRWRPSAKVTVRGRVLARGGRDPVVAATLLLDAAPAGETGDDGSFSFETTPGRHRLQIQAPGFEPAEVPVIPGATTELVVRLNPRLVGERYETVVARPKDASGETLAADTLLRTAGSLGEPFRVIESLPGVSQVVWPLALYSVRGANPGNTGFFLDDIRLPTLFHFALGPAVIHPHFLEKLEFYPGGYPSRYGRFVAGVVSATTAPPPPDRPRGSVDVRLYDAGAIVTTPINEGQGTIALAGRYSYTGLLFSLFSPSYTMSYWDYQARMDHTLGPGRLTVFAFGSGDDLGHKELPEVEADITFHRLDARWLGVLGPGRLQVRTSLGFDRSAVTLAPVVTLPIRIRTLSAAPRMGYLITGNKLDFEIGADSELQQLRPFTERDDANQDLFRPRNALVAGGVPVADLAADRLLSDHTRAAHGHLLSGVRPPERGRGDRARPPAGRALPAVRRHLAEGADRPLLPDRQPAGGGARLRELRPGHLRHPDQPPGARWVWSSRSATCWSWT